MIDKAKEKFEKHGLEVTLKVYDFRKISSAFDKRFDCVMSTGNSLPHVKNKGVEKTLGEMKKLIKKGGYIYFDIRNWNRILEKRKRFYILDPVFDNDTRINYMQIWDYNPDGSTTFNIIISYEKNKKIYNKNIFQETYYPIEADKIIHHLENLGFTNVKIINHVFPQIDDFEKMRWYCVIGKLD